MSKVKLRFAPSPTGSLHVGGARTALFNYLYAKHHGGDFLLRIEDTDTERSTLESAQSMLTDLNWLGIQADEGVVSGMQEQGQLGPYRQSQRLTIYREHVQQLLDNNLAYYCFMTDDEISRQKETAKKTGTVYRPMSPDRNIETQVALKRIEAGERATIRFRVSEQQESYHFFDLIRGDIQLPTHMVGDFVLLRSDGMPVYNFACVIDDALMQITHVFRGEEHLSNTLKQLMLYQAFSWTPPAFGHLSIILDSDRKKLSKRHLSASCAELKSQGFLPGAVINALVLLGWSHPAAKEIFDLSEMIELFSVDRIHASSAAYDLDKLRWMNTQYIHRLSQHDLLREVEPWVPEIWLKDSRWRDIVSLFQNELVTLQDMPTYFSYFTADFTVEQEALDYLRGLPDMAVVQHWHTLLNDTNPINAKSFKQMVKSIGEQTQRQGKNLFMPLRVAITGRMKGPEMPKLITLYPHDLLKQRALICLESVC
ncbi:MAG: glutamate--tRNA ligase [Legionellales bacterium]|nr:glutamate--tRNA ligase [Legionellales bacterium]|tara:strand:- start:221 stop:1666 length:1446 start_codon:yes stop_codon:yes gene_type:complete